jgi:alkylated DNA repair dioxygenase AlkB
MIIQGVTYLENFLSNPNDVFNHLKDDVSWDESMAARKTASYGVAYNYSQMSYPFQPMLPELQLICEKVKNVLGFKPNNCLINYYLNGTSKMGFHSDQTDILENETGVVIVSLGQKRILRFRNIKEKGLLIDFELPSGSLLYMTQDVQKEWEHAIPKSEIDSGRMSLTLRKIK